MIEELNRKALLAVVAPDHLDGERLLLLHGLAQWLIYPWPAVLVLLWLFGREPDRRAAVAASVTSLLAWFIAQALAGIAPHPRPFMIEPVRNFLNQSPGNSFPSGHVALLWGFAVSAYALPPPAIPRLWLVSALAGAGAAGARMVLGAHYPLDVAGSIAVAAVAACLVHSGWGRAGTTRLTRIVERLYGIAAP